jgi:hypothetical protein
MPEELKELTDCQTILLDLLFHEDHRDALRGGSWVDVCVLAGYTENISRGAILRSKLFRDELEKRLGEYQVGLEYQAFMVNDDILSNKSVTPFSQIQLSAAKDILDRSKRFVKRSETKHEVDSRSAVILLPAKEEITEE